MAKFDPFLSLDCSRVESVGAQSKERKGSNFAAQRSGAIVQKPEGPNTYDLKIRLQPSGNHVPCVCAGFPQHGSALAPHPAAAVHDEDVGGQAEHEGRVERQVLVVGPAKYRGEQKGM